jgi:2-methylisocitrate lyase-like PEP mutase family enzyme
MDDVLAHYRELAAATDVPLNADFENGFADDPDKVAANVTKCIATGVSGLSIEDSPQSEVPLYEFDAALARVKAARAAIDKAGGDVVFTARTEGFIRGRPDIDETIRRLKAFADAGADCLYSPGIKTREHIEATVKAVGGKAINFLNFTELGFTVNDLAGMGVRRISVGGTLSRVAMDAFIKSARAIASEGRFDSFAGVIGNAELNKFFGEDRKKF